MCVDDDNAKDESWRVVVESSDEDDDDDDDDAIDVDESEDEDETSMVTSINTSSGFGANVDAIVGDEFIHRSFGLVASRVGVCNNASKSGGGRRGLCRGLYRNVCGPWTTLWWFVTNVTAVLRMRRHQSLAPYLVVSSAFNLRLRVYRCVFWRFVSMTCLACRMFERWHCVSFVTFDCGDHPE